MTDDLILPFNFDGRREERALIKLKLINKVLCGKKRSKSLNNIFPKNNVFWFLFFPGRGAAAF